ncbi:MAG TPA: hypothetical protein VN372_13885 [Methanospirillum sp.]|nr:hypothetical protein [Methanospirillum sp.]
MAAKKALTIGDVSRNLRINPEQVWIIEPERDPRGRIKIYNPWERFPNRTGLLLNEFGEGPFCRFRIPGKFRTKSGVYLIVINGIVTFAGWCQDLVQRMNQHYGTISPRKCYEGSEEENCLVNHRILDAALAGRKIIIYMLPGAGDDILDDIMARMRPSWNEELYGSE